MNFTELALYKCCYYYYYYYYYYYKRNALALLDVATTLHQESQPWTMAKGPLLLLLLLLLLLG